MSLAGRRRGGCPVPLAALLVLAGCPRSAEGLLESADALETGHHYAAALAGYRDALRRLGQDDGQLAREIRTKTLAHLADLCYLDMADTRCASETYQTLLEGYPDAPESYQARIHYAEMMRGRSGDLRGAIAQYKALVSAYSDRPGADAFQLQAAQGYFELADYAQARTEARALLDRFPHGATVPQAGLLLANCFEMEGRRQEAIAAYEELIDRTPTEEAGSAGGRAEAGGRSTRTEEAGSAGGRAEAGGRSTRTEEAGSAGGRAEAGGRSTRTEEAGSAGGRAEAGGRSTRTEEAGSAGGRAEAGGRSTRTGDVVSRAQLALAKLLEAAGNDGRALEVLLACLKTYPDPMLIQHEIARLQRKMAEAKRLAVAPDAFDHAVPGKRSRKVAAAAAVDPDKGQAGDEE